MGDGTEQLRKGSYHANIKSSLNATCINIIHVLVYIYGLLFPLL